MTQAATQQPNQEEAPIFPSMNPEMREFINAKYAEINELKEERDGINKRISACYDDIDAKGLSKQAAKDMLRLLKMAEDQRRLYDLSSSAIRKAKDIPLQGDLFIETQVGIAAETHASKKRNH